MSAVSDRVRLTFRAGDMIRDAGLRSPEDVRRWDDIPYGPDPKWQSLDVYRPKAAEDRPLPVIVSVHGGGWVYGDKELYQYYCMGLAQRGFAVVNFTYRLAPEFQFPASLEDTNAVFTWVLANGARYGFDLDHVFGIGDSAGAHLLGLYTDLCTNSAYAKQYQFQAPAGFAPLAIVLNCGQYEIILDDGPEDTTRLLMEDLLPEKGTAVELEQINVLRHITGDFPPTFLMTCNGDFLRAQAPLLAAKLTQVEVPFVYRCYGSRAHPLSHNFQCNIRTEDAKKCSDEECTFFRSFCASSSI